MKLYVFEGEVEDQSEYALIQLKRILKDEFNYQKIELIYNKYGKPYLENNPLYFNISHCSNYIAIAISDKEIGIDIERFDHYRESLIEKVCSIEEIKEIENSDNKDVEFIRIWCMKESLVKCEGRGIKLNMKDVLREKEKYNFNIYRYEKYLISVCEKKE